MFVWLVSKNKSLISPHSRHLIPYRTKGRNFGCRSTPLNFARALSSCTLFSQLSQSILQDFDVANARVGAERNPLKKEVIFFVNDLDAAPPEWRVGDVRSLAKTSAVTDGSITLGVAVGSRQFIADQPLGKAGVIRAMHERVQLCQDPQTEFALLRESLGVSHQPHSASVRPHDPAGETSC